MGAHHSAPEPVIIPVDPQKIKKIWMVTLYLALITTVEFIIAFTFPDEGIMDASKPYIYIALTIWKAYYIIMEFMHMGHEKKALKLSVFLPIVFLLWGILSMLQEASTISDAIINWWK